MKDSRSLDLQVTGLGVTSAIGQGQRDFVSALLSGRHQFDYLKQPGRQLPTGASDDENANTPFESRIIGAEIDSINWPESLDQSSFRTASYSAKAAVATLHEAWTDADLSDVDPERIGLIVGGSNFQQRTLVETHKKFQGRENFLSPTYGFSFMDTDVCGICTETFGIGGASFTVGGASASGQLAIIQAMQAVATGQVDVCIALGALMDLSYWECRGFRALGAMGSDRFAKEPSKACRPFDEQHDGFIFGESCGALVIENSLTRSKGGRAPYAMLTGSSIAMDQNRNPNPSLSGEVKVLKAALKNAEKKPNEIGYVNAHGTGSVVGDETELQAIRMARLDHALINATKSITGHGLSAAGITEAIATILQMKLGQFHPTLNLEDPIDPDLNWIRIDAKEESVNAAINLSLGFGGINTAVCIETL